ncbi:KinB-signaling pathway activation protein [Bacillaceae bacterium Marseille-Q3522]|nr:KinB-signaling pathway activation protein [Bacillaceae bacterium Marseille-Q3522]
MTSRYWVKLFLSTLFVGGLTTGVFGFIVRWEEFKPIFVDFDFIEILSVFIWLVGVGFIFSVLSQAGFFAYLTIHRFGLGIFKTVSLWNAVQLVLIAFVLFDLVYLRYQTFAADGESVLNYLRLPGVILIIGVVVAFFKAKMTNKHAFIPAMFFMVVVSSIELLIVLNVNEESWIQLMTIPLLVCNAYQLLVLHKYNELSRIDRANKQNKSI